VSQRQGVAFIWAMLGATAALAVLVIGYIVLSVPITQVFNQLNLSFPNVDLNGVTMSDMTANLFELFGAAFVIAVVFVVGYVFFAAHSEENDTGEVY